MNCHISRRASSTTTPVYDFCRADTVLGITFKENCTDIRDPRVVDIAKLKNEKGVVYDVKAFLDSAVVDGRGGWDRNRAWHPRPTWDQGVLLEFLTRNRICDNKEAIGRAVPKKMGIVLCNLSSIGPRSIA